jgi:hypothetical protein
MIVRKFAACQDCINERETDFWSVVHGNGGCAIQFYDGRSFEPQKHIVDSYNLPPIGRSGSNCFRVHRGDGRLQRVRSKSS